MTNSTKVFIAAIAIALSSTMYVKADDEGDNSEPRPVLLKEVLSDGTHIPHAPARPVANLLGISDHTLYVYPTDDAQVVTITLKDDNDAVVFSTTLMLAGNTEQVTLPASLTGTYTLLYNIGGVTYVGGVNL